MSSTLVDRANELRRAVERLERKMQRAIDRNRWEDFLALRLGAFYIRRELNGLRELIADACAPWFEVRP